MRAPRGLRCAPRNASRSENFTPVGTADKSGTARNGGNARNIRAHHVMPAHVIGPEPRSGEPLRRATSGAGGRWRFLARNFAERLAFGEVAAGLRVLQDTLRDVMTTPWTEPAVRVRWPATQRQYRPLSFTDVTERNVVTTAEEEDCAVVRVQHGPPSSGLWPLEVNKLERRGDDCDASTTGDPPWISLGPGAADFPS